MALLMRLAFVSMLLGAACAKAADAPAESDLRAAMVYKLMLFVEWPPGMPASASMLLCVVSDDPDTSRAFAVLAGRTVKGRELTVERRAPLGNLDECNAVYFDRLERGLLTDKLAGLGGQPVLTFATASAREAGAMIGLVAEQRRVAFEVLHPVLRAAGLGLDARVMQLAREVVR